MLARRLTLRLAGALAVLAVAAWSSSGAGAIAGGRTIPVQAAPWTVFILEKAGSTHFVCTGSVLDPTHVLTAAHCVLDANEKPAPPSAFVVRAGVSNFKAPLPTDREQERKLRGYRVHPRYFFTGADDPDDVSVLELAAPLDLSGPAVKAVALPTANVPVPAGAAVELAGFGSSAPGEKSKGPLHSLTGKVDPQGACGRAEHGLLEFNAIQICAWSPTSSVCNGDSGSGLVTAGPNPMLVGIVSAGAPGCDIGSRSLFTYTGAREILSFIRGNDRPVIAPREGPNPADIRWHGRLVVGNTITCDHGDWPGSNASFTYSFVNPTTGKVLQHGEKATFTIPASDRGVRVACRVAAANAGGTSLDESAPSPPVEGVELAGRDRPDEAARTLEPCLVHMRVPRLCERVGPERARNLFRGRLAVERRSLPRDPARRTDQRLHLLRRELLPPPRPRRARDRLVHQRPAEVVHPGAERLDHALRARLHPGDLDVLDPRVQREPGDRMHQQHLAEGRPRPGSALEVDRRLHVHERQRDELGEPARLTLELADGDEVARPVPGPVDVTEHDRVVRAEPDLVRGAVHLEPLRGRDLVGADHGPDLVVEHLGGGARQRGEPFVAEPLEVVAERDAERRGALPDLRAR